MPENFGVEEAGIPALISGTAEPKDAASSLAARHRRAHGRWKQLDSLELNKTDCHADISSVAANAFGR